MAAGTATATVTATDPDGLTATQSAGITVEAANQAPEAVGTIPAQTITAGQAATVDVAGFFSDPDGDALTYTAASSDEAVVSVSLSGSSLTVAGVAAGTATATVTAADPDGLTATQSAEVTVEAPNRAPETVGTIPSQTITAGQAATVDVAGFFSDPDGDELTYTAESSDAAVATASVAGSSLTVRAVAAGTATVTVTAADPDGLTATQSTEVTVEAANRAPETVGTIPSQTITAGQAATVDVAGFFSDPDGDELTYTAESGNTGVVTVDIAGSSLTMTAVAAGTATVTATATDPGGLSATQSVEVTVAAGAGFRDDFDSAASLDDWEIRNADATVVDGVLRLTAVGDERLGVAEREPESVLTEWTIRARMGRAQNDGTVRLIWFTGDDAYPALGISLGPGPENRNYLFLGFDATRSAWVFFGDVSGNSEAIRTGAGEFTDLTIGRDGGEVFLMAGDTELQRFIPSTAVRGALSRVSTIWLVSRGGGSTQLFDWIDVTGTESSADMSDRSGVSRKLDLAREALEASEAKPIRLKR
ncbi:Ig-like domain-containing protein [Candidatus Palauibacter sp.]|uniref:Ig-like domain-containing protein n=1 Tax=Candidatus Palauibacter sp. TaxID=3101350 RepID=UPI003B015042